MTHSPIKCAGKWAVPFPSAPLKTEHGVFCSDSAFVSILPHITHVTACPVAQFLVFNFASHYNVMNSSCTKPFQYLTLSFFDALTALTFYQKDATDRTCWQLPWDNSPVLMIHLNTGRGCGTRNTPRPHWTCWHSVMMLLFPVQTNWMTQAERVLKLKN